MLAVRESVFIKYDTENEVNIERAELDVDTAADLPSADYIPGRKLYQGSIAHDISTGDFYAMDSTGTWYNQDGSGAYTPASASTLSAPKLNKIINAEDVPDINVGENIEQVDAPVELTKEHESEGTSEITEEIPEIETLESKEVIEDAEPLRNSESE
jgi:hypothetical protein